MINNHPAPKDRVVRDPFQLAFPWLINGGDPNYLQVLGWSSKLTSLCEKGSLQTKKTHQAWLFRQLAFFCFAVPEIARFTWLCKVGPGSSYKWGEITPISRIISPQLSIYFRPFIDRLVITIYNPIYNWFFGCFLGPTDRRGLVGWLLLGLSFFCSCDRDFLGGKKTWI